MALGEALVPVGVDVVDKGGDLVDGAVDEGGDVVEDVGVGGGRGSRRGSRVGLVVDVSSCFLKFTQKYGWSYLNKGGSSEDGNVGELHGEYGMKVFSFDR